MLLQIYNAKKYKSRPGYEAEVVELLDSQRNSAIKILLKYKSKGSLLELP